MMISVFALAVSNLSPAYADEAGHAWLENIDQTAQVNNAHLVLKITVTDARGKTADRQLDIWQQGDEERLVRIMAPARLKGVGLLVTQDETVYINLPGYGSRRVVGSKRADSFMGTDFAVEDLSRLQYASHYSASVVGTEDQRTVLSLTPNQDTGSTELKLWVDAQYVVRKIEHIDHKGQVTRRLRMDDVRQHESLLIAHHLVVEDLERNRRTEAWLNQVDLNPSEALPSFTLRDFENP